nr:MAG TPA: hypothetical protein [Caudoviricetes sp.]
MKFERCSGRNQTLKRKKGYNSSRGTKIEAIKIILQALEVIKDKIFYLKI